MKVIFSYGVRKELHHLDRNVAQRIYLKIMTLEDDCFPSGYKKLEGDKGYRIRIGDYRVVYFLDTQADTITIVKVAHRKDVYR